MRKGFFLFSFVLACALQIPVRAQESPAILKSRAYELYQSKRFDEAAQSFKAYLAATPADRQAALDYAGLLSELGRHEDAVKVYEDIRATGALNETASFKLAVEYVALKRYTDAEKVFAALEKSNNPAMANAAASASRQVLLDQKLEETRRSEQQIYDLATQSKYQDVISAVNALGDSASYGMQLQRLYAMEALHEYATALAGAERLALTYPSDDSIDLLRAELLVELGRRFQAEPIWRAIIQRSPGKLAAVQALQQLNGPLASTAEQRIYELAQQQKYAEVVNAVAELEKRGPVSFGIQMQRVYALQKLGQYATALKLANLLATTNPTDGNLALARAELFIQLDRRPEAEAVWREIAQKAAGTQAAVEAERQLALSAAIRAAPPNSPEARIYELALKQQNREVISAVGELEKSGPLSFNMQMQRLYAWQSLHDYSTALKAADQLAVTHPTDDNLALLRAELLLQLRRRPEADAIWRQIQQRSPGTSAALLAGQQLAISAAIPIAAAEEDRIYELVREGKHRDVIAAVNEMEQKGPISLNMQLQRLYSYQALGESKQAIQALDKIVAVYTNSVDLAFLRSDLLVHDGRPVEASTVLREVRGSHPGTPVAAEADRRLEALPPIADLEKHFWGEAYNSGDYLGRFGTLVGAGYVREGAFVPEVRWLQPYVEFRYDVDTHSGVPGQSTIVSDNFVGFYGGIRAQLLPNEYLFVYGQVGTDKDLLDNRNNGNFAFDYQAGIYGFKSWGPGRTLFSERPEWTASSTTTGGTPVAAKKGEPIEGFYWRGEWFADAGADFSYYHRYQSAIGYGQARQGFRLFQVGPHVGFDAYIVEDVSWDVKGNYYDNFFEGGPGARLLWSPHKGWEVVLRAEWLPGVYFGRGEDAFTVPPDSTFEGVRVGLSVGARW